MTLILNKDDPLSTPVQTRDGRKARIVCVLNDGGLAAVVDDRDGEQHVEGYTADGLFHRGQRETSWDLINAPRTWWVNAYVGGGGMLHDTRESADSETYVTHRIACIKFTEGEGL